MTYFQACHHCGHVRRVTAEEYQRTGRRLSDGGELCDRCIAELTAKGVTIKWAAKINIRP
jgi:hypothetical protein